MELLLFKTLWGHAGSIDDAIIAARQHGFDGIEGQAPAEPEFRTKLTDAGLDYIAEICTAGSYVPDRHASVAEHLDSFRRQAEAALDRAPRFLTVIAGCDAWPLAASVEFFGAAMEVAEQLGTVVSFETHRSRSMFNPWITRDILRALPGMRLTCDFSHWCCVCERLIDTEPKCSPFAPSAHITCMLAWVTIKVRRYRTRPRRNISPRWRPTSAGGGRSGRLKRSVVSRSAR